ncbi:hypothetical protein GH733_011830 [Mirounga leonina]|nr:hypothetical protein GH733_011830 [Mirounga leonina]
MCHLWNQELIDMVWKDTDYAIQKAFKYGVILWLLKNICYQRLQEGKHIMCRKYREITEASTRPQVCELEKPVSVRKTESLEAIHRNKTRIAMDASMMTLMGMLKV